MDIPICIYPKIYPFSFLFSSFYRLKYCKSWISSIIISTFERNLSLQQLLESHQLTFFRSYRDVHFYDDISDALSTLILSGAGNVQEACVEGLNVINGPKCNKVLNVITFCPKCNKVLNVINS